MADKYEDLLQNIENDDTFDMTRSELVGARVALQWIDQNRGQAPGRTITESQLSEAAGRLFARRPDLGVFMGCLQRELSDLGITVIPDPKPTNAEKWEAFILQKIRCNPQWDSRTIAEAIDAAGVKAPGGDDESDADV